MSLRDVYLSSEQSIDLLRNLIFPSNDTIEKRERFLEESKNYVYDNHCCERFSIEIPDLDLSFLNEDNENE